MAGQRIKAQARRLASLLPDATRTRIEPGAAPDVILDAAKATGAAIIVLGGRRLGGLRALASVSRHIVHDALLGSPGRSRGRQSGGVKGDEGCSRTCSSVGDDFTTRSSMPPPCRQVPDERQVLKLNIPRGSSIEAIPLIREERPETPIVVLTLQDEPVAGREAETAAVGEGCPDAATV